jgi:hypothetical protein
LEPDVGVRRVAHSRAETIDARTPEPVEAIGRHLDLQNAALVRVLAYEGLRAAEAYALFWGDLLDDRASRASVCGCSGHSTVVSSLNRNAIHSHLVWSRTARRA